MQFKVPQFLDIEDKIFGSFTFREFVYLAGGAGICFVIFKLLGLFWGAVPIALIAGFSLALAFYKPNNKPFINMVEAGLAYFIQDKLYVWKMREGATKSVQTNKSQNTVSVERGSKLDGSKLRDLAWSLDVLDLNKNQN